MFVVFQKNKFYCFSKISFKLIHFCYIINYMEKFYVFLDIDGVLWDWKYQKEFLKQNPHLHGRFVNKFDPKCIDALNFLLKELSKKYNVQLVISSTWRLEFEKAISSLLNQGLLFNKKILATPIMKHDRQLEIETFLQDKPNKNNFVILDDDCNCLDFDQNKIIKTNIENNSLSKEMVRNFLNFISQKDHQM